MCGGSDHNATGAGDEDVVPPAALAAALVMIAAGIALVVSYGCRKKRAWRPEQTYVLHDFEQASTAMIEPDDLDQQQEAPASENVVDFEELPLSSKLEPAASGLSNTLKASLLNNN